MKNRWVIVMAFFLLLVFGLQLRIGVSGVDYYYHFHQAVQNWIDDGEIYSVVKGTMGNPPWLILMLYPLVKMTYWGGEASIVIITLATILRGWRTFLPKNTGWAGPCSLALCLFNLHVFDLYLRLQIDAFILLGVILMYRGLDKEKPVILGLGWVLAVLRPTTVSFLGLYTLWLAYRRNLLARAIILPALVLILSFVIFGWDWGIRWYEFVTTFEVPPTWITTWWRMADYLNLSPAIPATLTAILLIITLWTLRHSLNLRTVFAFLSVSSLLITPYALSYHYLSAMIVFIPLLLSWRLWLGIPIFLLTTIPVVRIIYGPEVAWLDILLPLTVWIILVYKINFWDNPQGQQLGWGLYKSGRTQAGSAS